MFHLHALHARIEQRTKKIRLCRFRVTVHCPEKSDDGRKSFPQRSFSYITLNYYGLLLRVIVTRVGSYYYYRHLSPVARGTATDVGLLRMYIVI